jgi:Domain of unknown function (DUF3332)
VALAAIILFIQTGCIGSFKLTQTVLHYNRSISEKFVSELVFLVFCIIPVYEISIIIDALILNLVEFWTGTSPMAMLPGQVETQQIAFNGKQYIVTATHNRFHAVSLDGKFKQDLVYNEKSATWSIVTDNKTTNVCTYNNDGTIAIYNKNNVSTTYTVDALKKMANNKNYAMK